MYSAGYGTHPYASCPELFSNSRKAGWGFLPCAPGSSGDEPLQSGGCGLSLLLVAEHFKIHFSFIEKCYRGTWLKKVKHYKKVYNERYISFFPRPQVFLSRNHLCMFMTETLPIVKHFCRTCLDSLLLGKSCEFYFFLTILFLFLGHFRFYFGCSEFRFFHQCFSGALPIIKREMWWGADQL